MLFSNFETYSLLDIQSKLGFKDVGEVKEWLGEHDIRACPCGKNKRGRVRVAALHGELLNTAIKNDSLTPEEIKREDKAGKPDRPRNSKGHYIKTEEGK